MDWLDDREDVSLYDSLDMQRRRVHGEPEQIYMPQSKRKELIYNSTDTYARKQTKLNNNTYFIQ